MFGCFWTNGQICSATSRLVLHESIADRFLPRLVEAAKAIPLCEPLKPEWAEACGVLGPLVSRGQHAKVSRLVYEAIASGAECLTGGKRPWSRSKGFYYEPTVLKVDPDRHEIWRTEVSPHSRLPGRGTAHEPACSVVAHAGSVPSAQAEAVHVSHRVAPPSHRIAVSGSSRGTRLHP